MKQAYCCGLLAALLSGLAVADCLAEPGVKKSREPQSSARTIVFPPQASLGELDLFQLKSLDSILAFKSNRFVEHVGVARGTVKIAVPANRLLMLALNHNAFAKPQLLDTLPADTLDAVTVHFASMDDSEDHLCDAALAHVARFTNLQYVSLDRSDTTDVGLAYLKNLSHLRQLTAFSTSIRGTTLASLSNLKELEQLSLSADTLVPNALASLVKFPKLNYLNIDRTQLTKDSAKYLSECTHLITLRIGHNGHVDDSCMKCVAPMKSLKSLDVRRTNVSIVGLRELRGIDLLVLQAADTKVTNSDSAELKSLFPHARIFVGPVDKRQDEDVHALFAPLKE